MNKIFEANNYLFMHTQNIVPDRHRHMAAHIIVSPVNEIRVVSGSKEYICHGIMIPSGAPHKVCTDNNPVLIFMFDSTTAISKAIEGFTVIDKTTCAEIYSNYLDFENNKSKDNFNIFENKFLQTVGFQNLNSCTADDRITEAINFIKEHISEKLTRKTVASAVYLSEDRFSHLFKQHTGMTFSAYLIYQRIMYAYALIFNGKSITEAAHFVGFSSSSHFTDINRRVFGMPARSITQNLHFFKIC